MLWRNLALTFVWAKPFQNILIDIHILHVYSISKVEIKRLRESLPPARLTQQRDELFTMNILNGAQEMQRSSQ
jgi:hypothetical protein